MIYNSKNQLTKRVSKDSKTYNYSYDKNSIRGYTGHRQLYNLNLIDMGGRMYDTAISRFLSVDPLLQDMTNSQNYNRYIYVLNNPLRYTDPSGYDVGGFGGGFDGYGNEEESSGGYGMSRDDGVDGFGYDGGDGGVSQSTTPVSVFNPVQPTPAKPKAPEYTTQAYVQNTKNMEIPSLDIKTNNKSIIGSIVDFISGLFQGLEKYGKNTKANNFLGTGGSDRSRKICI